VSTRLDRSVAGRDVLSASERLLDGLLIEEHRCFEQLRAALAELAERVEARVRGLTKGAGRPAILLSVNEVLPNRVEVHELLLPPIGDLLAITRERTLVVAQRQLRACESVVAAKWEGTAARATAAVRAQSGQLESAWFIRAQLSIEQGMAVTAGSMVEQARIWWTRGDEPVGLLVTRWCDPEPVRLPGSEPRGALWGARPAVNAAARNASVALTNALLLAGMSGWNQITQAS